MKKALIINVLIIVLVASLSIAATFAYFSGTDQSKYAEVTTAKVAVGGTAGFPLEFLKLLPGDTQTKIIRIENKGDVLEDFYVQMIADSLGHTNFCYNDTYSVYKPMIWLTIKDSGDNVKYSDWICKLYSANLTNEGMAIAKLADDVPGGESRDFRLDLTLSTAAGNAYQSGFNIDYVNIIGVQYNGPAPVPATGKIWPDGDPAYE
jgi:predicted ribosomally synthesized peptide with SipW-like signal peptide